MRVIDYALYVTMGEKMCKTYNYFIIIYYASVTV